MPLGDHIKPWSGDAYRHLPKSASIDPFDFNRCGKSTENRWNMTGEPTLYLASSKAVALGEYARHLDTTRSAGVRGGIRPRTVVRYSLSLTEALDLHDLEVCRELGFGEGPEVFVQDVDKARVVGAFVRRVTGAQGLIVPSMAFLDSYTMNWNLVLFLEKLVPDQRAFILSGTPDGGFAVA